MTSSFEFDLDALLDSDDEKRKQKAVIEAVVKSEAEAFVDSFKQVSTNVIKPVLSKIKSQLEGRGRKAKIDEKEDSITYDGKHQQASLSIYFGVSESEFSSRLHEYAHVTFFCNKQGKIIQVHESTIMPGRGGQAGAAGTLGLEDVTEETIQRSVMKVLRTIYA